MMPKKVGQVRVSIPVEDSLCEFRRRSAIRQNCPFPTTTACHRPVPLSYRPPSESGPLYGVFSPQQNFRRSSITTSILPQASKTYQKLILDWTRGANRLLNGGNYASLKALRPLLTRCKLRCHRVSKDDNKLSVGCPPKHLACEAFAGSGWRVLWGPVSGTPPKDFVHSYVEERCKPLWIIEPWSVLRGLSYR